MRPRSYPGVEGRIHPHDHMKVDEDLAALHYAKVGQSALDNIHEALIAAGRDFDDVEACLDLPCGYGRVLRLLQREIPPARITACDLNREAIRFCGSEFGVKPLLSHPNFLNDDFERYDLIWCGSLLTHLTEDRCRKLVRLFAEILVPGGIAIVTTHGLLPWKGSAYEPIRDEIDESLRTRGFFHTPYQGDPHEYGHAWHTKEYVCDAFDAAFDGGTQLVRFRSRGWDDHQDVFAFKRTTPGSPRHLRAEDELLAHLHD